MTEFPYCSGGFGFGPLAPPRLLWRPFPHPTTSSAGAPRLSRWEGTNASLRDDSSWRPFPARPKLATLGTAPPAPQRHQQENPMRIETSGHQIDVTPALRDYVNVKFERLAPIFRRRPRHPRDPQRLQGTAQGGSEDRRARRERCSPNAKPTRCTPRSICSSTNSIACWTSTRASRPSTIVARLRRAASRLADCMSAP